ncbi:hypothetical protein V2J09_014040 [Rumex salicifolius]
MEAEPVSPATKRALDELYEVVRDKRYPLGIREKEQKLAYSMLMDHLDDIETRTRRWKKYVIRAVELVVFCGLVALLVCFLSVEPTNRQRLLKLRLWQWATMALMITAIFSVVPCATWLLSLPFRIVFRTHKYWVYYLRKMKRSVDYTLWSCLVLAGWYMWFRPRLKHVYGDVSVIVCQQVTRLLIALCIGFLLWIFKTALYLKLEADLHYDQLFDRVKKTIEFLNGLMILQRKERAEWSPPAPYFLSYDEEALADFWASGATYKKPLLVIKYEARRKWRNWCRRFKTANSPPQSGETAAAESVDYQRPAICRNIWMDVRKMKRESVPIWILVRLTKEYLKAVKSITPPNVDELINDVDDQLLETAKQMFRDLTGSTKLEEIDQFREIERKDLLHHDYNLSEQELDCLFRLRLHESQKIEEIKVEEKPHESQQTGEVKLEEEIKSEHEAGEKKAEDINKEGEENNKKKVEDRSIGVDEFLQWAVRVHKHCWGLERTLKSSKTAFVKLNRMLGAFLFVVVVIIWLLLSKIVNTGQLALLFAPFLAASFMFENSSKNLFQGIIFAFAMHPFDVGDRVIIENIQMRVMKVHILTSVFYKYDTGAEVIFPNSKLATTKIVNLDITPDQSDMLDFIIHAKTPLENIRDLELTIQRMLDDDIYYPSGTKVVKNSCHNPENQEELKMSVHFKYLVSYLTVDKKAKRKSEILGKIMRLRKEMETEENKKEYPLDYKPYDLELETDKKGAMLLGIRRVKQEILNRVQQKYKHAKVVLTHVEDKKFKIALYVCEDSKVEVQKKDEEEKTTDYFFHGIECKSLKIERDKKQIYNSPTNTESWRTLNWIAKGKDEASSSQSAQWEEGDDNQAASLTARSTKE